MTFINPLANAIAAQPLAQRAAETEKARQVQRQQTLSKNAAATKDELVHEVESADAIHPTDPNGGQSNPQQQHSHAKGQTAPSEDEAEHPHIDLKA